MIIGLTGKARSGKTTMADYLCKEHGFIKINFKDALVQEMKENFPDLLKEIGYTVDMFNQYATGIGESTPVSELFDTKPPLMRALMQNYGTDVRRKDDDKYWVQKWADKVGRTVEETNVVVDDCRFLNEADAVKLMGGEIVKVKRTDIIDTGNHQSEIEMDLINQDWLIECKKGDLDSLYKEADALVKNYEQG